MPARLIAALTAVLLLLPAFAVAPAGALEGPPRSELDVRLAAEMFAYVNDERAARGLPRVEWDAGAADFAQNHALAMVARGEIYHANSLYPGAHGAGENVSRGSGSYSSAMSRHAGLMRSDGHRRNLLRPSFTHIGIGAVCANGQLWIVQSFTAQFRNGGEHQIPVPPVDPIVHPGSDFSGCTRGIVTGGPVEFPPGYAESAQPAPATAVQRIAGSDRFATAAAAADPAAATVVIASGADWPDAVAAAPLAGSDGTVLLVERDRLPESTAAALATLRPGRVLIMGGTSAVSDGTVAAVMAAVGGAPSLERLAGLTRIETAAVAASSTAAVIPTVVVADAGTVFDGLNAAATALGPLLLVGPGDLPDAVIEVIRDRGVRTAHVIGEASLPDRVTVTALQALGLEVHAVAGDGADHLSTVLAAAHHGGDPDQVLLASATSWPDTLTAAALAVRSGTPLLLTHPDGQTAWDLVQQWTPDAVTVVGGTAAIPDSAIPAFLR
ncbi:hypothetical protein BH23ACT9_BH23ACT9_10510 [soil metagenome]